MKTEGTTTAILGLGLMGGSLGLALRNCPGAGLVRGYARRKETRDLAEKTGCCHELFDHPAQAVHGAGIVVVCLPVLSIPACILPLADALAPGAIVTDVGSTKAFLHARLDAPLARKGIHYVGSHPICGSEKTGLEAARADLYEGARIILTHTEATAPRALEQTTAFWSQLGGFVASMRATRHDEMLARTSHLPHLLSCALVRSITRDIRSEGGNGLFGGSGYRDMTRLADGSPAIWKDIVETNRTAILKEISQMRGELEKLELSLGGDISSAVQYLEAARGERNLVEYPSAPLIPPHVMTSGLHKQK